MPKNKRDLLPPNIKKKIGKDVTITDVSKTACGLKIVGKNPYQNFEELWSPTGKTKGFILRLKNEPFWQVWKGEQVVTVPIKGRPGSSMVIGSTNKKKAWKLMLKKIGGCKRKK